MAAVDFEKMSEVEDRRFAAAFTRAVASDQGDEAKRHLAAGRPIYYMDDRNPDAIVKEHPDGRRQLVALQDDREVVLRDL